MRPRLNLIGNQFGRLKVIKFHSIDRHGHSKWETVCECGNKKTITGILLQRGETRSCGCFRKENAHKLLRFRLKHGLTYTPTWNSWKSMLDRCTYSKSKGWKNYGGRGITVCRRWGKFENFLEDMGIRPKELTLDRINNSGNYEPNNCRWATWIEQAQSRRRLPIRTHCSKGHIFSDKNTYHGITGTYQICRMCRCIAEKQRQYLNRTTHNAI